MIFVIIVLALILLGLIDLKFGITKKSDMSPYIGNPIHMAVGAITARMIQTNQPLAAILTFLSYMLYQYADYVVNKDNWAKDILTYMVGFLGYLGYNVLSQSLV